MVKLIKNAIIIIAFLCQNLAIIVVTKYFAKKAIYPESTQKKLTLMGSASMQEVCDNLAIAFMKTHPAIEVIKSGTGSGEAANAVANGVCQIGDISRTLNNEENPSLFTQHVIAYDGIAICTNIKNKVKNLTKNEIKKIFSGEIKDWGYFGGKPGKIVLVGRDFASGNRTTFEKNMDIINRCRYSVELDSNGKVKYKIQHEENAIGYISFNAVDKSVNSVNINGVAPNYKNILNTTYTLKHPLIQITKKDSFDEISNLWFNFVYSPKGKQTIEENGLLSVDKRI